MQDKTFEYIQNRLNGFKPDTAIVLGSGLANLTAAVKNPIIIPYADVPGAPRPSVNGHNGYFYAGTIGCHNVICLQGRTHLYEGLDPRFIALSNMQLKELGVKNFIATNAAGSLTTDIPVGGIMLIKDHINFSGRNPLIRAHPEPYFPDMSEAYDLGMRKKMQQIAVKNGIKLYEGIYLMVLGPNYETPAEVRMFRNFGADAVGMSTVPEVISAVHVGFKVMGVSIISNFGAGLTEQQADHSNILQIVKKSSENLSFLLQQFLTEE